MNEQHSRDNTLFLRFLAIVLVVNSHMDIYYPIPIFSTGGAIGNSLFFMLSSYGLLLSEIYKPQTFIQYFTKRILRIYPVIWTSILFLMFPLALYEYVQLNSDAQHIIIINLANNPFSIISFLFFPPSKYWFLQALMFFYFLGFFYIKKFSLKKLILTVSFLILLYIIFYIQFSNYSKLVIEQTLSFKLIFYAMVYLFGIYLAYVHENIKYNGFLDYIILLGFIMLIYTHKYFWMNGIYTEYQFIQQLLIFPMLYYFLKVSYSPLILDKLMKVPYVSSFINLIAAMTLEIYIVHVLIRLKVLEVVPVFPQSIFAFLITTFVISFIFYKGNTVLIFYLKKRMT